MSDKEFTELVNRYTKLIYTVCYKFLSDHYEAENMTQETFLTAFRAIHNFVGDNYKPWLVRIATNKCKDYLKSSYVKTTKTVEDEALSAIPDTGLIERRVESEDRISRITTVCHGLPPPYNEVAYLYFIEDKSFEEVATQLDRPLKTIQTQVYRARDKLKLILKEESINA